MGLSRVVAEARAGDGRRAAARSPTTARRGPSASSRASTSPTIRRSRASRASSSRQDYVYSHQALARSRTCGAAGLPSSPISSSARAPSSMRRAKPGNARLRPADRRPARARPLHAAAASSRSANYPIIAGDPRSLRRRARSRRGRTAATSARAPSARGPTACANGGADRASCSRRIPSYRAIHFPASSDPAQAALVQQHAGQDAAADRRDRDQHHRGGRDAAAGIRARGARLHRRARRRSPAGSSANDKLKPEYAARGIARHVFPEPYLVPSTSTWRIRSSAGWATIASRCAARSRSAFDTQGAGRGRLRRAGDRRRISSFRRVSPATIRRFRRSRPTIPRARMRCSTALATTSAMPTGFA